MMKPALDANELLVPAPADITPAAVAQLMLWRIADCIKMHQFDIAVMLTNSYCALLGTGAIGATAREISIAELWHWCRLALEGGRAGVRDIESWWEEQGFNNDAAAVIRAYRTKTR